MIFKSHQPTTGKDEGGPSLRMEYKNFEFRNKSFHTLLFVLAVVLQYRLHLCWGAPVTVSTVGAVEDDINSNTTIINGTLTATAAASSSEELGDEFA